MNGMARILSRAEKRSNGSSSSKVCPPYRYSHNKLRSSSEESLLASRRSCLACPRFLRSVLERVPYASFLLQRAGPQLLVGKSLTDDYSYDPIQSRVTADLYSIFSPEDKKKKLSKEEEVKVGRLPTSVEVHPLTQQFRSKPLPRDLRRSVSPASRNPNSSMPSEQDPPTAMSKKRLSSS